MSELKPVFTVHELNEYIDLMLGFDPNLKDLAVEGELEAVKRHSSGHLYFTLKDEQASVNCVMFRQYVMGLRFLPKDGQRVRLVGRASLYQRDGRFQLMATGLMPKGDGSLYAAFAAYKEELKNRGWFDESLKKPIPFLPKAVGMVTSANGAAWRDVQNVIARRFPQMPLLLYPTAVQGEDAAEEIAKAIDLADSERRCDVLIVGRGGGSMEDLWAFNEPPVADAIHRCTIPVISAVGHETDVSISDFIADLRAPTPSAAAELAVPQWDALTASLQTTGERLKNALQNGIRRKRDRLDILFGDSVLLKLHRAIDQRRQTADELHTAMQRSAERSLEAQKHNLEREHERLRAYSPQQTLKRGFALVAKNRTVVSRAEDLALNDGVTIRFYDGTVRATVTGKEEA
ncbi:MAG: exodeoxyribonuclease VII large subunit [Clostridia bacterium]|nr:exodeoxyribonuclease VII large subunit [Clostridia bacterium]